MCKHCITYLLFLLTLLSPQASWSDNVKLPNKIKVGIIAPLSGKGASRGESTRKGLELALEKIKRENLLPNSNIQLVYQDIPLNKVKLAPTAFTQLVDIEKVHAVIGPMGSTVSLSVTPLVDRKRIPVIVHTASALKITEGNKFVFRLWPTAKGYVETILRQLEKLKYKRIASITTQQDNTIDFITILEENLNPKKHTLVSEERVTPEETDFRSTFLRLAKSKPDVIFLNLFEGQIGLAAKQLRELGIDTPLFTNSVMSAIELKTASRQLEKIWFPRFEGYGEIGRKEFIEKYNTEPSTPESAASAHDALLVLTNTFAKVGVDPDKVRDYILNNSFSGITGKIYFLKNGDAKVPLSIRIVKNGNIETLDKL